MISGGAETSARRLTRRGRVVLVGFLALIAALIGLAVARGAAATGSAVPAKVYERHLSQVVVRPGDTLWSIAARAEPDADPRLVIQHITDINALPSADVAVGQRVWVPRN